MRILFTRDVRRRVLGAMLIGLVAIAAGCRTRKTGQDIGTSTGLPYRPPGNPTYVELPAGFTIYPTPTPAQAPN